MLAFFKQVTSKILCCAWGDAYDKSRQVFWFPHVTNGNAFACGKNFSRTCTIGEEPLHHNYLQKPYLIMVSISLQCLYFGLQKRTGKRNVQDCMS
jgi:hypothetical protein